MQYNSDLQARWAYALNEIGIAVEFDGDYLNIGPITILNCEDDTNIYDDSLELAGMQPQKPDLDENWLLAEEICEQTEKPVIIIYGEPGDDYYIVLVVPVDIDGKKQPLFVNIEIETQGTGYEQLEYQTIESVRFAMSNKCKKIWLAQTTGKRPGALVCLTPNIECSHDNCTITIHPKEIISAFNEARTIGVIDGQMIDCQFYTNACNRLFNQFGDYRIMTTKERAILNANRN